MRFNEISDYSGNISTQNIGSPNGNAVTAGSTVTAKSSQYAIASIQVSGTYTGQLTVQGTVDGINWVNISTINDIYTGLPVSAISSGSTGIWKVNIAGLASIRVTALAPITGNAVINIYESISNGATALEFISTLQGSQLSLVTAATTNATSVKAASGNLFELTVSNPTATAAYVKLYDKATAPVVGTDVPVATLAIPATAAGVGEKQFVFGLLGKRFVNGIAIAVTGAAAATDTSVAVAGVQITGTYL